MSAIAAQGTTINVATQAHSSSIPSVKMTMGRIRKFIAATGDDNEIHRDVTAARRVFGDDCPGPVAHGMLVVSMLGPAIVQQYGHGTTLREVGSFKPSNYVAVGDTVEFEISILESSHRSKLMIAKLSANIVRVRGGVRENFFKAPIEVRITKPMPE